MRCAIAPFLIAMAILACMVSTPAAQATPYSDAVLADNPIAYYRFEEVGGTTAIDSSGNGNNATYVGSITHGVTPSGFAPLGTTAVLTGGYVDVNALGSHAQTSIEAWVNITGLAGGCCTSIYSADNFNTGNLHFNLVDTRAVAHAIGGGGPDNVITANNLIQNGNWYHVVATYDTTAGGATNIYINGAPAISGAHASAPTHALIAAQIGAWNGGRNLPGSIDEFAIYDSILSPARVAAHYATTQPPPPPPTGYELAVLADNPLVYYRFEESPGATTAKDSSGNGNNGAYVGPVGLGLPSADVGLGTAANFLNGSPDTAVAVPALGTQSTITIEAWVNPRSKQTFDTIYNTANFPNGAIHMQFISDGRLEFTVNNPSDDDRFFGSNALLPLNSWSMINVTYDANTNILDFYLNGALLATASYTDPNGIDANLLAGHIGAWNGNSREFDGLIDEFAIYGSALSANQIQAHYDARVLGQVLPIPEPATLTLGLMGLAMVARRRRKA